jgi:cell division protein FtsB
MKASPAREAARALRRRILGGVFWFLTVTLVFNALFGDMGLIQGIRQRSALARLAREVDDLRAANERLAADVRELKSDPYRIETIAREELGLARPGEILFLFPDPQTAGGRADDDPADR